jgi:uncharacterized membrane protein YfcA
VEVLGFAAWCFVVAVVGGVVGLVLGNLRLPLVVVLASTPAAGAGTNLAISAVAAATAAVTHLRAGRFNPRLFAVMAPPSVLGAVLGGYASGRLPGDALLGVIAVVLLVSGVQLLRRPEAPPRAAGPLDEVAAAGAGLAIGVVGGVVGLILGSLRMPALLRWVGEVPHRAVGTNLAVGVCVGIAGALAHLPDAAPDVPLLVVGAAASVPGALVGARLTGRLTDRALVQAIGVVLLVAAAATAAQAIA